jgi:hypothetical protein
MVYPSLRGENVDMLAGVQGHGLHPPGCSSQLASYLEVRVRWPSDHKVPLKDVVLHTSKSVIAMTGRSCHRTAERRTSKAWAIKSGQGSRSISRTSCSAQTHGS